MFNNSSEQTMSEIFSTLNIASWVAYRKNFYFSSGLSDFSSVVFPLSCSISLRSYFYSLIDYYYHQTPINAPERKQEYKIVTIPNLYYQ